jgi:LmbE family N-acetylglucosaminyl deacetylase
MFYNILVIAPHPDDEILGCGGTIKKYTSLGYKVVVLIVSRGKPELYSEERIKNVRHEARMAHDILNVDKTIFLDFPAPDLDTVPNADISASILKVIKDSEIGTVLLPHYGDLHHDHKAVFNAGLVASRPFMSSVRRIFSYETLSETEWAVPIGSEVFIPTCFVDISDVFRFKLDAMKCYKSQLREFPNPRSLRSIESLASFRGSTVGLSCAEAFMTIRIIDNI